MELDCLKLFFGKLSIRVGLENCKGSFGFQHGFELVSSAACLLVRIVNLRSFIHVAFWVSYTKVTLKISTPKIKREYMINVYGYCQGLYTDKAKVVLLLSFPFDKFMSIGSPTPYIVNLPVLPPGQHSFISGTIDYVKLL